MKKIKLLSLLISSAVISTALFAETEIIESEIPITIAEHKVNDEQAQFISKKNYLDLLINKKNKELEKLILESSKQETIKDDKLQKIVISKDNNVSATEKAFEAEMAKAKEKYLKEIAGIKYKKVNQLTIINENFNKEIELIKDEYLSYEKENTQKTGIIQKEIEKLQVAKTKKLKVKNISKTVSVEISNMDTMFDYIHRTKSLENVVLKMDLLSSLESYIRVLKGVFPFSVEERVKHYLLEKAKDDKDIDFDEFSNLVEKQELKKLTQALKSIREYKATR